MLLKTNLCVLLAVVLLICCIHVCAQTQLQTPAPAAANTEEPTIGTITGSVVNESGQPLAGVTVNVRDVNPSGAGKQSTTDAEGNFRFTGLAPSLYYVSAYLPPYVAPPFDPTAAHHRIGDSVKIEMVRGGVITGTVTTASGDPVIGIRVRAAMIRNAKDETPALGSFAFTERTTDDRGVYRIFGMRPGTYLVSAGGSASPQAFSVSPFDWDMPTYSPSGTRDNAAEISVRPGEETTADIRYRSEPGRTVSGSVKLTGPQSNINVSITAAGGVFPIANTFQVPGNRNFSFNGIGDGEYDLVAQEVKTTSAPTPIPELLMSEPRRVTVKGADVTGIELVTRPLGSITGRVVLEPSKIPACEGKRRPLYAETLIVPQRPEKDPNDKDSPAFLRMLSGSTSPDAKGDFTLRNLTPTRYLLDTRFYARYWYLSSITIPGTPKVDAAANWTTLKSGEQIANLTITIAEGAASLRGRVSAASGDIPVGGGVYLLPAEREKIADVLRYFVAPVAADGTFTLGNIPPGRYLASVQPIDSQTSTTYKLRLPEAAEKRTKVRRAVEAQKTDLELKPCQNLTDFQLAVKQ
ncbi:MAG TPA: carboxypeptidase-like regulatory domain-containing protein [Pyrinomonadaceae bacterium]|nr:carboxypeptidase-like regulatory domain-containing protein [Pyrinomonadaceae bacterium]